MTATRKHSFAGSEDKLDSKMSESKQSCLIPRHRLTAFVDPRAPRATRLGSACAIVRASTGPVRSLQSFAPKASSSGSHKLEAWYQNSVWRDVNERSFQC